MRTRSDRAGWVFGVVAALAAALACWPAEVRACQTCAPEMWCVETARGALACIGSGDACLMAGRCGLGRGGPYLGDASVIQVSLLEDSPGLGAIGRSRVLRGAGPLALGRRAQRLAREAADGLAGEPEVLFSGIGTTEDATLAFRSRRGDGFTLRRDADGRGAIVTVRNLWARHAGALLARERLDEDDALAVRVTLDGRPRVLIVQAPTLPHAEAETREREARLALRGANGSRPGRPELPFELDAVAD